jgi:heme-degrading monooxygenase HmoA
MVMRSREDSDDAFDHWRDSRLIEQAERERAENKPVILEPVPTAEKLIGSILHLTLFRLY